MDFKKAAFKMLHWETWHYLAKYFPLFPVWLWYCIKARSLWFFTPSNPTLTFGGFEGESKKEMYDQLPPGSYPRSIYISPTIPFDELEKIIAENEFTFPFAVKPDVGMMGFMFRQIWNSEQLKRYHLAMPATYIVQHLSDYPLEVSVFYYRYPYEKTGMITGFLRKDFLSVTGDGVTTLWELIQQNSRASLRLEEMRMKHAGRLHEIIAKDDTYILSYALNLSRGGKLVSLSHQNDEKLLHVFDDLSNYTRQFYYGRYDIKCKSIEDLKEGKNFTILEYNGCGAEPHHIYGNGNTLLQAYAIVLKHWHVLYRISVYNNLQGIEYWSYRDGADFLKKARRHFKQLKQIDMKFEL